MWNRKFFFFGARSCVAAKIWLGAKSKIYLERAALRFKYESCFEWAQIGAILWAISFCRALER